MPLSSKLMLEARANFARGGGNFYKFQNGPNELRLLPGWPTDDPIMAWVEYREHYIGGDVNKFVVCLWTPGLERTCPICAAIKKEMLSSSDDAIVELGKKTQGRRVFLWNCLVRGKEREGPKIMKAGSKIQEQLLPYVTDELKYPEFLSLQNGVDIIIERSGKNQNVQYNVRIVMQRTPVMPTKEECARIFSEARDLRGEVKPEKEETMIRWMRQFLGYDPEEAVATKPGETFIPPAVVASPESLTMAPAAMAAARADRLASVPSPDLPPFGAGAVDFGAAKVTQVPPMEAVAAVPVKPVAPVAPVLPFPASIPAAPLSPIQPVAPVAPVPPVAGTKVSTSSLKALRERAQSLMHAKKAKEAKEA